MDPDLWDTLIYNIIYSWIYTSNRIQFVIQSEKKLYSQINENYIFCFSYYLISSKNKTFI